MMLTDTALRNLRPGDKPRKVFDADGLYLYPFTTGHRSSRLRYRFASKEKHLHFGRYPEISAEVARDMRLEARRALELGNDPGAQGESERLTRSTSFEAVAGEWMEIQRSKLVQKAFEYKLKRDPSQRARVEPRSDRVAARRRRAG